MTKDFREQFRKYFIQDPFPYEPGLVATGGNNDTLQIFDGQKTKSVVDANSGCWGPISIGYSNPYFLEALSKQAGKLIHTVFGSQEILEFAKKIVSVAPDGLNKVLQVTCASHADEVAMRLSWKATGKWGMVVPKQGFHGHELNVLGLSSALWPHLKVDYPTFPHSAIMPNCYCYRCPLGLEYPSCGYKCAYLLEDVIKYGSPYPPAALIMEPVQQATFSFPPSNEYFKILGRICKDHDMYFIVDEAQYGGVGRLGEWFASQLFEIPSDIIVVGKGIGNGVPIGVVITSDEIVERAGIYADEKMCKTVIYTTHQFDPLVAAAGKAVIEYIEQNNLVSRAKQLGEYMLRELRKIQKESRIIGRVDGRGLYIGAEIVKDRETKEPFLEVGDMFTSLALSKGVFFPPMRGTYLIGIRPPLTVEKKNVDLIINVFAECIKEIEKKM